MMDDSYLADEPAKDIKAVSSLHGGGSKMFDDYPGDEKKGLLADKLIDTRLVLADDESVA